MRPGCSGGDGERVGRVKSKVGFLWWRDGYVDCGIRKRLVGVRLSKSEAHVGGADVAVVVGCQTRRFNVDIVRTVDDFGGRCRVSQHVVKCVANGIGEGSFRRGRTIEQVVPFRVKELPGRASAFGVGSCGGGNKQGNAEFPTNCRAEDRVGQAEPDRGSWHVDCHTRHRGQQGR